MTLTRDLLSAEGITPKSVMLISRPYQERRAFATCRKLWPDVEVVCTSQQVDLDCQAPGLMETGLAGFQGCGDRVGHRQ
jgi:hypothetical protein